jgi:DNA repair protein RadC
VPASGQFGNDRPREKLARRGLGALTNAELMALVIRSGVTGLRATDLSQRLIDRHGSLAAVLACSVEALSTMPGLGLAKAGALVAAIELARRASLEAIEGRTVLDRPQAVRDFLALLLTGRDREVFVVLFVDSQNRLIRHDEMFHGTLSQTAVYPREIVKRALDLQAAALLLAHNHPSGLAQPSQADLALTQALRQALTPVGISVLDHLIVAGPSSYSFAEHGRL